MNQYLNTEDKRQTWTPVNGDFSPTIGKGKQPSENFFFEKWKNKKDMGLLSGSWLHFKIFTKDLSQKLDNYRGHLDNTFLSTVDKWHLDKDVIWLLNRHNPRSTTRFYTNDTTVILRGWINMKISNDFGILRPLNNDKGETFDQYKDYLNKQANRAREIRRGIDSKNTDRPDLLERLCQNVLKEIFLKKGFCKSRLDPREWPGGEDLERLLQ